MAAVPALSSVSMQIEQGHICALLGENGAGKSTFIGIIAGVVQKSAGEVWCGGWNIDTNPRQAKQSVGIVPQEISIDPFFSPYALVSLVAGMHGVRKQDREVMALLERLGLKDKARAYARRLSGGMLRRLMVAKAMVHRPPLLVLDEPTAGVDVLLRRQLWDYVLELNGMGVSVLLTTHYLEEAEKLANQIVILDKGRVIADASKEKLLASFDQRTIHLTIAPRAEDAAATATPELTAAFHARAAALFEEDEQVTIRGTDATQLSIDFPPSRLSAGDVIGRFSAAGVVVTDLRTSEPNLEEMFLALTSGGQ